MPRIAKLERADERSTSGMPTARSIARPATLKLAELPDSPQGQRLEELGSQETSPQCAYLIRIKLDERTADPAVV